MKCSENHFLANTACSIESILLFPITFVETLFTFAGPFFFILLYLFYDSLDDDLGVPIELHSLSFLVYTVNAECLSAFLAGRNIGRLSVPLDLGAGCFMVYCGDF